MCVCVCVNIYIYVCVYIYGSYTIGAGRGAQPKIGFIIHLRNGGGEHGLAFTR